MHYEGEREREKERKIERYRERDVSGQKKSRNVHSMSRTTDLFRGPWGSPRRELLKHQQRA